MKEERYNLFEEDFETLWNIDSGGQTDPIKASNTTPQSIEKYNKIFLKLEKLGYIKIEMRDKEIYGAMVTEEGKKILENKELDDWVIALDL